MRKPLPRTFEPDYGIDGPDDGGVTSISAFACRWTRRGAITFAVGFALGFAGRSFGLF